MKKKLVLVMAAVMLAVMILACAGAAPKSSGTAQIKGVYTCQAKATYSNSRPTYNFYTYSYSFSTLTLFEDGTYEAAVSDATFSAVVLDDSSSEHSENPRNNSITKVYGTYTSQTNEFDDELTEVTLSAPTRIVRSMNAMSQSYWLDTANWTEDMGKVVAEKQYDTTGAVTGVGDPLTAEQYLAKGAFTGEKNIEVNEKSAIIVEYEDFGVKTGFTM